MSMTMVISMEGRLRLVVRMRECEIGRKELLISLQEVLYWRASVRELISWRRKQRRDLTFTFQQTMFVAIGFLL